MKNINIWYTLFVLAITSLHGNRVSSQSSSGDNLPGIGKYLGFSGAQNLELRTNNTTYMQMMQNGNSTINGFTVNRLGFVGLSQNPTFFTTGPQSPFSLLHLNGDNNAGNAQEIGYRSWMRHGITLTHNQDLMYVGQRRLTNDVTDAVIAWADNEIFPGPDNLCFVFTKSDGSGTTPTEPDTDFGREIARMTAIGHTGIGIQWTNTFQPKRTLDVVRHDNTPQFRITRLRSSLETGGIYADFETSGAGNLHIFPSNNGVTRNVGIGFLSGISVPTERLDVDGTARLRQVPDNDPHVLITGRMQEVNPTNGDYVLNHLEFNNNPNSFLAGNGTWQAGTNICDWTITGQNLSTGHSGSCLTGNVAVGRFASNTVRLDALVGVPNAIGSNSDICAVRGINNADGSVNNGILAVAAQLNQSESVGVNRGGYFIAANAQVSGHNIGVYSVANDYFSWETCSRSYGLLTFSARASNVYGGYSNAQLGSNVNVGVLGSAQNSQSSAMNA